MAKSAILALCAGAIMLSGCMTNEVGGPGVSAYYDCGNGTRLKVDNLSGDRIQVQMNQDEPLILPAVKAASGARYMTPRHDFWSKGDEATWTVGRMMPMTCQKVAVPRM
ncbi:MAG: MliC family protein [Erythrobacter sp.]|jgi:membrane-bound inhibitor of C-type lysozyme